MANGPSIGPSQAFRAGQALLARSQTPTTQRIQSTPVSIAFGACRLVRSTVRVLQPSCLSSCWHYCKLPRCVQAAAVFPAASSYTLRPRSIFAPRRCCCLRAREIDLAPEPAESREECALDLLIYTNHPAPSTGPQSAIVSPLIANRSSEGARRDESDLPRSSAGHSRSPHCIIALPRGATKHTTTFCCCCTTHPHDSTCHRHCWWPSLSPTAARQSRDVVAPNAPKFPAKLVETFHTDQPLKIWRLGIDLSASASQTFASRESWTDSASQLQQSGGLCLYPSFPPPSPTLPSWGSTATSPTDRKGDHLSTNIHCRRIVSRRPGHSEA